MQIGLSPMRRDDTLTLFRADDILTINGVAFDFSPIPEGATLPRDAIDCDWLSSDVTREDGVICLTLILPHGANAPCAVLFPETIEVVADGAIELPAEATVSVLKENIQ